ncbi:septum formation inhibitor Maf [Flavobacterium sp. 316]|uniref:dTTP/UTP pyrophosphatase n=1 Tax=Flavobacterium sediminilitoris TaxID=2024526 RepID=A0ABY4HKE5_9FLAO|nr:MULTISPECIES: Maf-like protein [Flavobacterium]KIX22783.1 septum formation inhibitor Maf [Flavobacterium sp. 316]UOX33313.1 Maf-like protein [Flavobacterium sediminilitoris]
MLKDKLNQYNIILASGSPRRQQFFKEMDVPFTIQLKEVEEIYPDTLKAEEITNFLSELKANAFENLQEKDILITSDTIVWHEEKALGKPKNYDDAFKMLQSMSGKTHRVITSVSFKTKNRVETIHEITHVTFKMLSDLEITYYLDHYKPFDKAGSYGIQEWIGLIGISKIEGSYTNVVGLPVEKVYSKLLDYA